MGVGVEVGQGVGKVGQGVEEVGLGVEEVGLGVEDVGQGEQEVGQGEQKLGQGAGEVGTSHFFSCIISRMYASITGKRGSLQLSVQQALAFVTHCLAVPSPSQFSVRLGCIHIIAVFTASCWQEPAAPGGEETGCVTM